MFPNKSNPFLVPQTNIHANKKCETNMQTPSWKLFKNAVKWDCQFIIYKYICWLTETQEVFEIDQSVSLEILII